MRPLTPLFNEEIRRGTPSPVPHIPVVPPCVPSLSILDYIDYDGSNQESDHGKSVWVEGDYAYVVTFDSKFVIFNIANPSTITVESATTNASLLNGGTVLKEGNTCYVVGHENDSICIYDVSDVTAPSLTGTCYDQDGDGWLSSPNDIVKIGDYLFVAAFYTQMWDISTPSAPVLAGVLETLTGLDSIVYDGTYVYGTKPGGVYVLDPSTPSSPSLFATYADAAIGAAGLPEVSVIRDETTLYVSDEVFVFVLDASTPASISELGTFSSANIDGARGMVKDGDYLYVAARDVNGVAILDVSDPASISEVDFITDAVNDSLFSCKHLAFDAGTLYCGAYFFTSLDTGCP